MLGRFVEEQFMQRIADGVQVYCDENNNLNVREFYRWIEPRSGGSLKLVV